MKNKTIKEATQDELGDFEELMAPVIKCIRENWNVKDLKPNGYDKYLEKYSEYDISEQPEFDGLLDVTPHSPCFPGKISLSSVAYGDTQEGRDPLEELVGALVSYGLSVGRRYEQLEGKDDYFIQSIKEFFDDATKGWVDKKRLKTKAELYSRMLELKFPGIK